VKGRRHSIRKVPSLPSSWYVSDLVVKNLLVLRSMLHPFVENILGSESKLTVRLSLDDQSTSLEMSSQILPRFIPRPKPSNYLLECLLNRFSSIDKLLQVLIQICQIVLSLFILSDKSLLLLK